MKDKVTIGVTAIAGCMDGLTGLLLILNPAVTLGLMGVDISLYTDVIFIRFIGAFVFGVGGCYILGLIRLNLECDWKFLEDIWLTTAWIRLVVFAFTTFSIYTGKLDLWWAGIPVADGILGVFQIYWVKCGQFRRRN